MAIVRNNFRMMVRKFLLSCLIVIVYLPSYTCATNAFSPMCQFERISVEEGLSNGIVYSITQDKYGFIWIGTEDGINRYDGYSVQVFRHDPHDSLSLSATSTNIILRDRNNTMWIGTWGGGLNRYDYETESFSNVALETEEHEFLRDTRIQSLYQDRAGFLWIGTFRNGVFRLDPESGNSRHFFNDPSNPHSLSDNRVWSFCEGDDGILWIGTNNGLDRLNLETGHFDHFRHSPRDRSSLSENTVRALSMDHNGELWVGTRGGLNRFNMQAETFERFLANSSDPSTISDNTINALYEDSSGVLWIGTNNGLNVLDENRAEFQHPHAGLSFPFTSSHNNIRFIYEDTSGTIWLGTRGGGANRYVPSSNFRLIRQLQDPPNNLNNCQVMSIIEDRTGDLWVATDEGLNHHRRRLDRFTHYRHDPENPNSLPSDFVQHLFEDRNGTIWVATSGGLTRFNRRNGQFELVYGGGDAENPYTTYAQTIDQDTSGILWIGTYSALVCYDPEMDTYCQYVHHRDDPGSLRENNVRAVLVDSFNDVWVGTFGGGVSLLNRETNSFTHFNHDSTDGSSLSSDQVLSIHEDDTGIIWVGTLGGGLNRLDRETGVFRHYTVDEGLPSNAICGILSDSNGHMWISTYSGLSRFDPVDEEFVNFDESDGLQSNQFLFGSCFESNRGEMFFGGVNGFNSFYPDSIQFNTFIPPVFVTDLQLFNRSVGIGDKVNGNTILEQSLLETETIVLSYKEAVLSFEFVALNYTTTVKNQYAYYLENFEEEWNYSGRRRFATYTNLSPGRYYFHVKASNNDGLWNEIGTTLRLVITPPFWQTWWFRGVMIALIIISILSWHQLRVLSYKRREQYLEIQVNERTSELLKANKKLSYEISVRKATEEELRLSNTQLKDALDNVETLEGMLPICSSCKKIRDDKGYWNQIEVYISERSDAKFSHGICPDCMKKLYPEFYEEEDSE